MKPFQKVNAAAVSLTAAGLVFIEYVVERLGVATTIFTLLPATWRTAVMSEPYLLLTVVILFFVGIGLLWSVAKDTAKATREYRASNDKAWAFSGEMAAFKEEITGRQTAVEAKLNELTEAVRALTDTVEQFRRERDNTMKEARQTANDALNEAATQAASALQIKIGQQRDHTARIVEGHIQSFRNEFAGLRQTMMDEIPRQVERVVSERLK